MALDSVEIFMDPVKVIHSMVQELNALQSLTEDNLGDVEEVPPLPESVTNPKPLTTEELEAKELYETAATILNKTRPDKNAAYHILIEAAQKGNLDAKALVAWAKLFGNPLVQDLHGAKEIFTELAEVGNADGHMGMGKLELIFWKLL